MGTIDIDTLIVIIYAAAMLVFGYWIGRRESADDFFVNKRKTKFWLLVFTVLSTSVGASSLLGVASAAYTTGISFGLSFLALSIVGWSVLIWLTPRIKEWADRTKAYTIGDYLSYRYSNRTRKVGGITILLSYFAFTAIQYVAAARLLEIVLGWNFFNALLFSALVTIIYTTWSGIKGDFYTDAIQFFVMLPIYGFLLWQGFSQVSLPSLLKSVPSNFLSPYNYAGPVFFYAAIIFGFALLISAMELWQRIFSALDVKTARRALIGSAILKIFFIIFAIVIGLLALNLVPGGEGDSSVFALMKQLLPPGLFGLGLASILAIVMSTVDSMIMVATATITKDFYLPRYPNSSEKKILQIGRTTTVIFGLLALLVAIVAPSLVRLSVSATQLLIVIAPALLGGLLWKRVNDRAAFWSILSGLVSTIIALPFIPDFAFIPGFLLCLVVFFFFVVRNKSQQEPIIG